MKFVELIAGETRESFDKMQRKKKGNTIEKALTVELLRPNGSAVAAGIRGKIITIGNHPCL